LSDHDSEDSQSRGKMDLESNNPDYSLGDSTIDLTKQYSHIETELDDESPTTTDQHRRYSSFQWQ